jgi:hypothetical protein
VNAQVWVDGWQMQCCGPPFEVGATLAWTVHGLVDRDFLGTVVGEERAAGLTHVEEHHADDAERLITLEGKVRSISAVFCRYAPRPDGPRQHLFPIPGSAVIEGRTSADGWETEAGDLQFVGYIVDVDRHA